MPESETAIAAYKWIAGGMAASYLPIAYAFRWVFAFFRDREEKQIDPLIAGHQEMASAVNDMATTTADLSKVVQQSNELEKARQAVFNAQHGISK